MQKWNVQETLIGINKTLTITFSFVWGKKYPVLGGFSHRVQLA